MLSAPEVRFEIQSGRARCVPYTMTLNGQQVWIAVGMGQGALVIPFSSGNHPAVIERPGDRSDTGPLMIGRRQDHRVSADWIP